MRCIASSCLLLKKKSGFYCVQPFDALHLGDIYAVGKRMIGETESYAILEQNNCFLMSNTIAILDSIIF